MIYVEAPNEIPGEGEGMTKVFLAGGITGCRLWRKDIIEDPSVGKMNVVLLNPRRENFPMDDPSAAEGQITWEFEMLNAADLVVVWFSSETIQPIVMFELGWLLGTGKNVLVGADARYERRQDVCIQCRLRGYGVHDTLAILIDHLVGWLNQRGGKKSD